MYVWIDSCEAAAFWSYDNDTKPFDGHYTDDDGETFTDLDERPFFRVIMTGETAGDLPISGIVNNIPIPNLSAVLDEDVIAVPKGVMTTLTSIRGTGFVNLLFVRIAAAAQSEFTSIIIRADGSIVFNNGLSELSDWGFNDDTQPIALVAYGAAGICTLMLTHRWEFRRSFVLQAFNGLCAVSAQYNVYPTMLV